MSQLGHSRRFGIGRESACLPIPDIPAGLFIRRVVPTTSSSSRNGSYGMSVVPGSVRLDPHKLDYLSPLLGFVGDELAEVDGRACERNAPKFCEARLQFGIDEAGIDL